MVDLPSRLTRRWLLCLPALAVGCIGPRKFWDIEKSGPKVVVPPAPAAGSRLLTVWDNKVTYAPDPLRGGTQMPGLVGKMYLFGPEIGMPLPAEGMLIVDLYDHSAPGDARMVHEWRIDSESLQKLKKADLLGDGYSLFLPADAQILPTTMTKMHLIARFDPAGGGPPLMSVSGTLSVDHAATKDLLSK